MLANVLKNITKNTRGLSKNLVTMVDAKLAAVPDVEIDTGVFKYILIRVYGKRPADGSEEPSKLIVRGFERCEWHSDIYDEVSGSLAGLGLETECLGGGRIDHQPDRKFIKIYGYSQGFGPADHEESRRIVKSQYPDYEIETTKEGY